MIHKAKKEKQQTKFTNIIKFNIIIIIIIMVDNINLKLKYILIKIKMI